MSGNELRREIVKIDEVYLFYFINLNCRLLGQSLFEFCLTVLAGVPQGGKGSLFPKISCWLLSVKIDKIDKTYLMITFERGPNKCCLLKLKHNLEKLLECNE